MPRRHLTELEVVHLITLLEEGYSQRQVANLIGVSHSVVGRAYSRYQKTGQYHRRSGQGRRRVTTSREDRVIARHARIDPFVHANVIASRFYNHRRQVPYPITAQTVRNRLREAHLRSFRPLRVPMLNNHHRRTRLTYARLHIRWNHRQWNNVLFTDESRFCLYGNDRRAQVLLIGSRRGGCLGVVV
ncbi:Transposable element Tc1 transposase [Formica fusca]